MSFPGRSADPFRTSLKVCERWIGGVLEAQGLLMRTALRSAQEARDVWETSAGASSPRLSVRTGDLARSRWFAFSWATLAAGDRLGSAASGGGAPAPGLSPALSPRTLVLGAVALELYLGYAALRERGRWSPGLVAPEDWELAHRRGAGRTLDAAQSLGGVLIKAAQFASTRPDLLPAAYVDTLSALQDRVTPRPWAVIAEAAARELDGPLSQTFPELDEEPLAAASIAQVHRASLRDGRQVALKVQYPGIAGLVEADLDALERIFETIARSEPGLRLKPITDYLRWTLPLELDFGREARAMSNLKETFSHRDDVVVPEPVEGLTTERLLVMEYVEGVKITDREALLEAGIDPREVAELLNDVYAEGLFGRGVLHADPHPGNLLVQPGPRLVLLDHGLTLDLDPPFVAALARMVSALGERDLVALSGALRDAGMPVSEDTDLDALLRLVGVLLGGGRDEAGLGNLGGSLGKLVHGIPPELLLVGRAIGLLDGITRQLAPEVDALQIVARHL